MHYLVTIRTAEDSRLSRKAYLEGLEKRNISTDSLDVKANHKNVFSFALETDGEFTMKDLEDASNEVLEENGVEAVFTYEVH